MRRVLVTGGLGFMGSHYVRSLVASGHYVVVLDKFTYAASKENLASIQDLKNWCLHQGSICNPPTVRSLLARYGLREVVNFAAETHVDRSLRDYAPFLETNVTGVAKLMEAIAEHRDTSGEKQVRFVHISTDEVYGDVQDSSDLFTESSPYRPNSPYSASKAAGDLVLRAHGQMYQIVSSVLHPVNNYGAGQHYEKLIPRMIGLALQQKKLTVHGNGTQFREWLHANDTADAVDFVIAKGVASPQGEHYNVGGGWRQTNLAMIQRVANHLLDTGALPRAANLHFTPDRPINDQGYAVDSSRLRCLGWRPRYTSEGSLRETFDWYIANPNWYCGAIL